MRLRPRREAPHLSFFAVALSMVVVGTAAAESSEPRIVHDAASGEVVISGKRRGRAYRLLITTDVVEKGTQRSVRPSGDPIGCDCSWEDRGNDLVVIREFRLTSGAATRIVRARLTDRVVSPHLAGLTAAVSADGRLVVCSYLGDGAGAALALWSLSLSDEQDWMRAGDVISDWSHPEIGGAKACRQAGETAGRLRGAKRWPVFIRSTSNS